jgi:hypothetical protein
MGKQNDKLIKNMKKIKTKKSKHPEVDMLDGFQTELEAVKVAWEIPHLTLNAEYMWKLLTDVRSCIKSGEPINHFADKIDELETEMPSEFISSIKKDDFNPEEFVNKICK